MKSVNYLVLIAFTGIATVSTGQVNFISNEWEKTKAEAKQQHKNIYMECYTD